MIEILWYGRGGQGCFTAARLLGAAAALYGGRCALAFPAFGPERRGAPVFGYTRIADRPITDRSEIAAADCADTFKFHVMAKALRNEAITVNHLIHAEKLV